MSGKSFALFAVGVLLCASCVCVATAEVPEETDAVPVFIIYGVIALAGFLAGTFVGYELAHHPEGTEAQQYARLMHAESLRGSLETGAAFTANAYSNYSEIWATTKDHWARQAELEAYSEWTHGESYLLHAGRIMTDSRIYDNCATLEANALTQINYLLQSVSKHLTELDEGDDTVYKDKIALGLAAGNTALAAGTKTANMGFMNIADTTGDGLPNGGHVYIGAVADGAVDPDSLDLLEDAGYNPSYLYNLGTRSVTLLGPGGNFTVAPGYNRLPDSFVPGIYSVPEGAVLGGDTLVRVVNYGYPLDVTAGFAAVDGTAMDRVYLKNGALLHNGTSVGGDRDLKLSLSVADRPDGEANPKAVSLGKVIQRYQALLDRIRGVNISANAAAASVWSLYDAADAKNHNLTTLVSPVNTEGAVLSEGMGRAIMLSALQQLAHYYDERGEGLFEKEIDLKSTFDGTSVPVARGSIADEYGNVLYSNVIFTPLFQTEDVRMTTGTELKVGQSTVVAIWHEGGESLTAWDGTAEGYDCVFLGEGYTIIPAQLGYFDGQSVSKRDSIDLDVVRVHYVGEEGIDLPDPASPPDHAVNWVTIACMVIGMIALAYGILTRRAWAAVLGIGAMAFGLAAGDVIWRWMEAL